MLIYDVKYIESISFQLSFAATFGIIIFSQSDSKLESTRLKRFLSFLLVEFRTALSAQAFTVPIIFWYFREISLIAPISNILISFTIAPIMLLGGMTIVLGLIDSNLGYIFSFLLQLPLQYMVFIVETLSKMPFIVLKL
jgi:competence protein ComEC